VTGRTATLVLCTGDVVHGCLPPLPLVLPWWQESQDVVDAARDVHGVEVTVLRLLGVHPPDAGSGGEVTYLAEVAGRPDRELTAWAGPDPLAEHPLRATWARPGGPAEHLAWAATELEEAGRPLAGDPVQVRTWNLSTLWRLPVAGGTVWLKVVADVLGPEGALLGLLGEVAAKVVPTVVGTQGRCVLLDDVAGADLYGAPPALVRGPVAALVRLQQALAGRLDDLLGVGVPDRRAAAVVERVTALVGRHAPSMEDGRRARLEALVGSLPARLAAVAACGLPETLVHGDYHPGNVRGDAEGFRVLDWADAVVGRPEVDGLRLLAATDPADRDDVRRTWCDAWRDAVPGADPRRALDLVAPVAAVLAAAVYQDFLDAIEPDERVYHRDDPAAWLARADDLLLEEAAGQGDPTA
jgi:hypothetical protein